MSGFGVLPGRYRSSYVRECTLTCGVLDRKLPHVPGTVILDDENVTVQAVTGRLKHGTGRSSHIVLNPQPSDGK